MTTDHFALLDQPRRPWLDPEALKDSFHRLVAEQHPDKTGDSRRFAEMNAAFSLLANPAARLRHLLELEAPYVMTAPVQIPPAMAEAFMRVATLRRAVDAFAKQHASATTPLAQALLTSERFALQRDVETQLAELTAAHARILAAIREDDAAWSQDQAALAPHLLLLQQELTYVDKWSMQLREALFNMQTA